MPIPRLSPPRIAGVIVLALTLAACGSPVNQENFAKIETGMTQQEVEALLGKPSEASTASLGGISGGAATWKHKDVTISIQFMNDKVQFKQFLRKSADD